MSNCWDNIIAVRGLCTESTDTLYWLDDLGVSLKMAAAGADEKHANGRKLVESMINQAWEDTFRKMTINGYQFNNTLDDLVVGIAGSDELTGTDFEGVNVFMNKGCKLSRFFLHSVNVHIKSGGATSVKVVEGATETVIYNNTAVSDTVLVIPVNKHVADNFSVWVDLANVTVYGGTLGVDEYGCGCGSHGWYSITGTVEGNNAGVVLSLQVRCDKSKHLCKFVDRIASAVRYRAAAYIWKAAMHDTSRFGDYIQIKENQVVDQLAWLDSDFNLLKFDPATDANYKPKGMFQKELPTLNLPVPKCKCCIDCTGDSYRIMIP
jgi:hypothetical protein